jgi:hypothetical protein
MKKPTTPERMAGRQPAHDTKARMMLHLFASGHSLNRFEAATAGDTCLNSTVSELAHKYGLEFIRVWEKVPNRFGTWTKVIRYRLAPKSRDIARKLLGK